MRTTSALFSAAAIISFGLVQLSEGATGAQDSTAIRPFTVPTIAKSALVDLAAAPNAEKTKQKE